MTTPCRFGDSSFVSPTTIGLEEGSVQYLALIYTDDEAEGGAMLQSDTLATVAHVSSWVLPFEALYQDALYRITSGTAGFTRAALQLGPFGGAEIAGTWLPLWTVAYLAVSLGAAALIFRRRDF